MRDVDGNTSSSGNRYIPHYLGEIFAGCTYTDCSGISMCILFALIQTSIIVFIFELYHPCINQLRNSRILMAHENSRKQVK